jgi:Na+/H+ antiporter NhaD/arsenite permease-like protein
MTTRWKELLWGTNVGGFGSLVGSLANLIAYHEYSKGLGRREALRFAGLFLLAGYLALGLSVVVFELLVAR